MKFMTKVLFFILVFYSSLFARYVYNIYPNSAGIVKYQAYTISDNKLVANKDISENRDIASIKIESDENGDLVINVEVGSQYLLNKPTIIVLDQQYNKITHRTFSDKSSQLRLVLSKEYLKDGTNDYIFAYAGRNDKYYFSFFFKKIQITKAFVEPVVTQIGCASQSYKNEPKGYVGDEFAFFAKVSEALPSGYKVYIAFMGVNEDGSNSGYYGQYYQMDRYNETIYTYKKVMQKAGKDRKYKIVIKNGGGEIVDTRIGTYTVLSKPIEIVDFEIEKVSEDNQKAVYKALIVLNNEPYAMLKLESTTSDYAYLFFLDGKPVRKTINKNDSSLVANSISFVTHVAPSNGNREWVITYYILKQTEIQNKGFKLIVKDKEGNIDSLTRYFSVPKKSYAIKNVVLESNDFDVPAQLTFIVETEGTEKYLKVESSRGETIIADGSNSMGALSVEKTDATHWKVVYTIDDIESASEVCYLTFTLLNSDAKEVSVAYKKSFTLHKQDTLADIVQFLQRSAFVAKLQLDQEEKLYHALTRADAAAVLYEFLKLKNGEFQLPFPVELYESPFADVDEASAYYKALLTLVNYRGSDDVTVLTKSFGVFNPLQNVTRFQFVKMVVEALDIPKVSDYSELANFTDYNELKSEDVKTYFATALKHGIIKGSEDNRLLPYDELTIFQMLTILNRIKDFKVEVASSSFLEPSFKEETIGKRIGLIPEVQEYDLDIVPIKIEGIDRKSVGDADEKCYELKVVATKDEKAKEFYTWSANFGYFKAIEESPNYKRVLFCPATKRPNVDYIVKVRGNDGYMNFDEFSIVIDRDDFDYKKNVADAEYVQNSLILEIDENVLKENALFSLKKQGSLYKDNLDIGIEKIAVTLELKGKRYLIENVKWNEKEVYFVVPSFKDLYGKEINLIVDVGTNKNYKTFSYRLTYIPQYAIDGKVEQDESGNYPEAIMINGESIAITKNGSFHYEPQKAGEYKVQINRNYPVQTVTITNENPTRYLNFTYIDLDYDDDGVENDQDAFPYDPAISEDSDGDGYPDRLHPGYTTATVPLDAFPNDPKKWRDVTESNENGEVCIEVITHAFNPNTGEERDFATPCDVPDGWVIGEAPDSDFDGVNDMKDAFPYDPAASVDSDGDGYPDTWNEGKSAEDSTTGLVLDAFPNDADRWQEKEAYDFFYPKGWSLKALPVKNDMNVTILDNAVIVWKYKDGKWLAHSDIFDLQNFQIETFDTIHYGEGFWIYAAQSGGIDMQGEGYTVEDINFTKFKSGWHLLGVGGDVDIAEVSSSLDANDMLWSYESGKWFAYAADGLVMKKIEKMGIGKLQRIKKGDGFWFYKKNEKQKVLYYEERPEKGAVLVFHYRYDGENCSIDFHDGSGDILLDSCNGSISHAFKKENVYRVELKSNGKVVGSSVVIVENEGDKWIGFVSSLNGYLEENENYSDIVKNSRIYIAPSLSEMSYYWTNYRFIKPSRLQEIDGDDFTIEAKIKNPSSEGGISCYDPRMAVIGENGKRAQVTFMSEGCTYYASVGAADWFLSGGSWNCDTEEAKCEHADLSALGRNFSDWRVVKMKVKKGELFVYYEDKEIYSMQYKGSIGKLVGTYFSFKGSGSVDWVKIYNSEGNLLYSEDFEN